MRPNRDLSAFFRAARVGREYGRFCKRSLWEARLSAALGNFA